MLNFILSIVSLLPVYLAQDPAAKDSNGHTVPSYSPARPPAVPLAVRSPYTNAWTSTSNNGTLNSNGVIFWPGPALGWEGIVTIDGTSYEYLGTGSQDPPVLDNLQTAVPRHVSYDSSHSNFTFFAGPVEVTASFLSPVIPKDICRTSIPLSYLTTSIQSLDGSPHNVQFYSDVNAQWIAFETNKTIAWNLWRDAVTVNGTEAVSSVGSSSIYSWLFALQTPYEFGEEMDFPQWGNFTYSSSPATATNFSFQSGFSSNIRYRYVMDHYLQDNVDTNYRGSGDHEPVFAYAHDLGNTTNATVRYTIGSVQQPAIRYLTNSGVEALQPWWFRCYGSIYQMINYHFSDFEEAARLAVAFDSRLKSDVNAYYADNMAMVYSNSTPQTVPMYSNGSQGYADGTDQFGQQYIFDPDTAYGFLNPNNFSGIAVPDVGEAQAYYSIVALSARQFMGAYFFTVSPEKGCENTSRNTSEPLSFQKEISSDGNLNTVDVLYPSIPFWLYANPELLKYSLNPLFEFQEGNFYPNEYSMHDLGAHFPNATGHVEGDDEYMPVEESGNMILMSYAYYKFTNNADWLNSHYKNLRQFSQYLIEFSLVPGKQLSTDDFAGKLINQTNLAIKGIVGLQAMAGVAGVAGRADDVANFSTTASNYYRQWEYFAIDPSEHHTMLSYEWRSSYGLLYNIYPDKLLNLGIIPQSLYDMQSDWYPQISQVFGIPLDNRHSYTKSDWELWTAATTAPSTRRLFVNAVGYWLNYTATDRAFTDLYETIEFGDYPKSPDPVTFIARPVTGGHFSLLALYRAGELEQDGNRVGAGSLFPLNSTQAVSAEVRLPGVASEDLSPVSVTSLTPSFSEISSTMTTSGASEGPQSNPPAMAPPTTPPSL